MKKETYVKMTQPFRDDPKRARALHRANKILTVVIFVAYPCLLLWLLWQKDMRLYKAICVPLDGFIIVTVVRAWINRKRLFFLHRAGDFPPVLWHSLSSALE